MHIEPGIVTGVKLALSVVTASVAVGLTAKESYQLVKNYGLLALLSRTALTSALVFFFFELLPHFAIGVSEVHFIFGSTLFLIFGAAPAALGLAIGLLMQGLLFAPFDLPQYGMNVTTLLVPLLAMAAIARRVIPANTAYVDVSYWQALKLSTIYQGGIVSWVVFWAFYGMGISAHSASAILTFGAAYLSVIMIEPVLDMAVLAMAKNLRRWSHSPLFSARLYHAN